MPLYEYRCPKCEHHTEIIQPLRAKPPRGCQQCGFRGELKKAVSAPAFQFKGSGWYVTDYGKAGAKKKKGAASEPAASEGGTGEATPPAAPAAAKAEPASEKPKKSGDTVKTTSSD